MKKTKWFAEPEELCKFLNKPHIGNVHGGFYQWDTENGGEGAGLIKTNWGMQDKWPIKLVVLIAESRCTRCNAPIDYWKRVMQVDGDLVDCWALPDNDPPERIKTWFEMQKKYPEDWENKEIFWWYFD